MSRDLYKSRKMYESPIYLILLIPLGVILIFFLCDVAYTQYFKYKLNQQVTEVFNMALSRASLHTETEMQNYIVEKLVDRGYNKEEIKANIILKDQDTILIVYAEYFSIVDSLVFRNTKMTSVKLKGYFNEYKEAVIEEYVDEIDDTNLSKPHDDKDEEETYEIEE